MKIDKKNTFINGQKADATLVNQNFDDLFSIVNGNIEADNIKNSSISLDKLSKKVSDKWLDPVANIAARDALTGLVAGTRVTVINDGFGNQVDYVYTGSAWVKISGTVAAQNYTEITGLTDQLKFKTLYANVIEYGAKGDGVQNESVYIQNAIDAVSASGGGTVFIPKGTYNINTTLRIKSYVKILCDADAVIKRAADISALVVNSTLAVTAYNGDKFWEIDGGIWDSAGATYPSEHTTIAFGHCQNVTIKNATFRNIKDAHFIEINSSNHAKVLNCVFTDYTGTTEQLQIDMAMDNVRFPWSEANGTPTTYDNTVCDEILISGNVFINGVRGVGSHSFVTGFTHKNIKIVDNHFENLSLEAIRGLNYEGVLIEGNSFKNCQMGVYIFNDNTTPLSGDRKSVV